MTSPLTFAWRNVVFASGIDDPWALYRLTMTSYDGLSRGAKVETLGLLAGLAASAESDLQILRVARGWSLENYQQAAQDGTERAAATTHLLEGLLESHADRLAGRGWVRPEVVLAVCLRDRTNDGFALLRRLRDVVGCGDARGITRRAMDRVLDAEARAFARVLDYLDADRLSTAELQWLLRRTGTRGTHEPWTDQFWRPQALVLDADDEDGGQRFIPFEATLMRLLDEPVVVHRDHLQVGTTVQTALVAGALPETTTFPGRGAELLFAPLEAVDFPVDAAFAARWIPNDQALSLVRRRIVDADHALTEESYGEHGPTATTAARPELARELEQELTATDRPPLLRGQLSLAVGASSFEELDDRVRRLRREYAPIALHRPKDVQLELWIGHLPGRLPSIRRYDDVLLPEQLGAMVPTATHAVGAHSGLFIGRTLSAAEHPVLFDVREGSRTSRAPAVLCTGTLGSGKTLTAQLLAYHAAVGGSRVVDLDPKGDHRLHELLDPDSVEHVELTADGRHRGLLDPMRIGPEDLRVELAHSFLTGLLPGPVLPTWQTEIRAAVAEAITTGARSCQAVVDLLDGRGEDGRAAARAIDVHASSGLLQLGFSDRTAAPLGLDRASLVSLRIANLTLPTPGTPKDELTQEERTGRALLRLLTVFALHLTGADWSQHKVLIIEELSQLVGDALGLSLVQRIVRLCRSQNVTPILVTQVVDDVAAVADLVGCFFAFGVETDDEAARVLGLLGLDPDDAGFRARLRSFRRGRCLMRDYEGRVGAIQVDLVDERLLTTLDTTPRTRSDGVA